MLSGKIILLISPQSWGNMFIAKHHYALELAKANNTVYFLNPPEPALLLKGENDRIQIEESSVHRNLFIIRHYLFFPYILKFHAKKLFLFFMKFQVRAILRRMKETPDIIWSFDLGNMYPFSFFPAGYKIFHPVDEPTNKEALKSGKGADIIFSVTSEILEKYKHFNVPGVFIHHGVSDEFFLEKVTPHIKQPTIRVGISGNFLRPDIDWAIFLQIVNENPSVTFECWGAYEAIQGNLGGNTDEITMSFINSLKRKQNVILHGPVNTTQLAQAFQKMDAFLVCYDVNKDASKGTNYHKIMEYLSTGKVILSNNVTTYRDRPDLIQMVEERTNNAKLPALFQEVINNLEKYNSPDLQKARVAFAFDNRYRNKIKLVEQSIVNTI